MQPQTQGQLQINDGTVLDPKVVKVMRAIRQVESGGKYDAVGDSGAAHGAFQYNEQTGPGWKNIARQYLGDENAPMDQANQNKATYYRIKEWKDQGRDPEEIAALWNGASKDPNTGRYIYNNPEYGYKFRAALVGEKQLGGTYQQPPQKTAFQPAQNTAGQTASAYLQPQSEQQGMPGVFYGVQSFGSDLSRDVQGRFQQGSESVKKLVTGGASGDLKQAGSGLLQLGGAVAGGVGDIFGRTLEMIPGVEQLQYGIGKGVAKLADTNTGRALISDMQDFAQNHPEAWKNIAAVGNIASIIPMAKGVLLAARSGSVALGKTFGQNLDEGVTREIERRLGFSKTAKNVVSKGAPAEMLKRDLIPDIETGVTGVPVYSSAKQLNAVDTALKYLKQSQDGVLDVQDVPFNPSQLGQYIKVDGKTYIGSPVQDSIEQLIKQYQATGDIAKLGRIEQLKNKLQQTGLTVRELNDLARMHGTDLNAFSVTGQAASGIYKQAAENTRKGLKQVVGERDFTGSSRGIDSEISKLLNIKKALEMMDNKPIVGNIGGTGLQQATANALGAGGEAVGGLIGLPYTGSLASRAVSGVIGGRSKTNIEKYAIRKQGIQPVQLGKTLATQQALHTSPQSTQ